jgi:hypothetical protein
MLTLYLMNSGKPALVINIAEILHTGHSTTTTNTNQQTNQKQQYDSQSSNKTIYVSCRSICTYSSYLNFMTASFH